MGYAARSLLNSRLRAFGEVTDLSLDTAHQRVRLRVALRGERDPVDVVINRYAIDRGDSGTTFTVVDAVASREWLTAVLREFAIGHAWPVPTKARVLSRLLN